MSVASEPAAARGETKCRQRSTGTSSGTTPPNQEKLKGTGGAGAGAASGTGTGTANLQHRHQVSRPNNRPCRLCWYCCCSCSCLAVRADEEPKDPNNELSNQIPWPSLDEIRSWGQSFDRLMSNPVGRSVFLEYLRSEYSEENILFWLACEELKNEVNQNEVEEKARSIYEEYVSMLSPKEVSLDAQVRDQVEKSMKAPTPHTFDDAQQQIYTLMHRDPYKRFIKSQLFMTHAKLTNNGTPQSTPDT